MLIIAFLWPNIFHNYTIADVGALVAQNTQLCDLTELWIKTFPRNIYNF